MYASYLHKPFEFYCVTLQQSVKTIANKLLFILSLLWNSSNYKITKIVRAF